MAFPPSKQSGFTLVELVIVLVLLGILSVVAMPKFFDTGSLQKKGYCNEVASALRYGQKLALAEGCEIRVRTSGAGVDLYRRQSCDGSSAFNLPVTHPGKGGNYSETPPAGISLSNSTLIFDAMGRARNVFGATTDFTITVGGDLSLNVIGETGFIKTP
ncbi:MAG: prepilin-type N-terminal cleavage/methylation domain-containing protein [Deltaproteobacteria bacterium]|nr:prepilin-type N-terminal cleavage/methylation domain-containing protein [Deltaproteobacteria bacterium]